MESGIPLGDIIVLGAIAAFIILRYRAMLGENRGRDEEEIKSSKIIEHEEDAAKIIQLSKALKKKEEKQKPAMQYPPAIADGFAQIKQRDKQFDEEAFLEGAKTAFEMVITAFNERDKETLKMLLADKIYDKFEAALDQQEKDSRFSQTTLVALVRAEFTRAALVGDVAEIDIAFESEQIQIVKNEKGETIEGDVSDQQIVEDHFSFARDTRSSAPDWKITAT